jgi:hypothetical protein
MTNTRDTADHINEVPVIEATIEGLQEPLFTATAIGDVMTMCWNLNNDIGNKVSLHEFPGGKVPIGVATTGSFELSTTLGATAPVTAVTLSQTVNGVVGLQWDASLFSSDVVYFIRATSADASLILTYP